MQFSTICVASLVIALAAPAWGDPPDAQDILRQAETTITGLKAIRYKAHGEADGVLSQRVPKMDGTVTMVRASAEDGAKMRLDAQVTPPGQSQPVTVQVASNGKQIAMAEHGAKIFIQRDMPSGNQLLNNVAPLLITEFAATKPFERESRAVSVQHVGSEKVGDVDCDVINVVLAQSGDEVRWYIAKSDHLPRRVQRLIQTPFGRSAITTTLELVDTTPKVDEQAFRLEKPEGFEEPRTIQPGGGEGLRVGSEAPDWTLKDAAGNTVTLKSLRGKIVLLDFWATWCMPCRQTMPGVQKLYEKYKNKAVVVYGVNCFERGPSDPVGMMKTAGYTYPQLLNANDVAAAYHVNGVPSFFLIGPDGKLLLTYSGFSPDRERQVEALIEKALAGMSGK